MLHGCKHTCLCHVCTVGRLYQFTFTAFHMNSLCYSHVINYCQYYQRVQFKLKSALRTLFLLLFNGFQLFKLYSVFIIVQTLKVQKNTKEKQVHPQSAQVSVGSGNVSNNIKLSTGDGTRESKLPVIQMSHLQTLLDS